MPRTESGGEPRVVGGCATGCGATAAPLHPGPLASGLILAGCPVPSAHCPRLFPRPWRDRGDYVGASWTHVVLMRHLSSSPPPRLQFGPFLDAKHEQVEVSARGEGRVLGAPIQWALTVVFIPWSHPAPPPHRKTPQQGISDKGTGHEGFVSPDHRAVRKLRGKCRYSSPDVPL